MKKSFSIDISEEEILKYGKSLFDILLLDRTTRRNIIWGTSDYEEYGKEYKAEFPITLELITGKNKNIIQPRIYKEKVDKTNRTKNKAEVFTPSWMCNEQNNMVDESWFGRKDVFNISEKTKWITNNKPIEFEKCIGKRWKDYVDEKRIEVTCGEAPYLVSRYDTVTGEYISENDRIGILDRKMRVVNENTTSEEDWNKWTVRAFQSVYGFEFQGDSLLLARENLLYSYIDYYKARFKTEPELKELKEIATIISWNIWQMDGFHYTVPFSVIHEINHQLILSEYMGENQLKPCYCKIRDWRSKETVTYVSLLKNKGERLYGKA